MLYLIVSFQVENKSHYPGICSICVLICAEPDATAPADAGADTNTSAAGSVSAELGSDKRHVWGHHGTLHAARRPGAGAP